MGGRSTGRTKRVRLSPVERRQQLMALGVDMLRDRPLEEVSIGEIAERAGISHGLLFHYFPSKQDFLLAIMRHVNVDFLERTAPDPSMDLFDMLHDAVQRYVGYVSENRAPYIALLRGSTSSDPELSTLIEQTRDAMVERTLARIPVPTDDPDRPRLRLAVRGWIAFTEETTLSWLRQETITREVLIDMLVESLPALARNSTFSAALRNRSVLASRNTVRGYRR